MAPFHAIHLIHLEMISMKNLSKANSKIAKKEPPIISLPHILEKYFHALSRFDVCLSIRPLAFQ